MPHITRPSYTRTNQQTAGRTRGGASADEQKIFVQPSAYQSFTQSPSLIPSAVAMVTAVAPDGTQEPFVSLLGAVEGSRNQIQNLTENLSENFFSELFLKPFLEADQEHFLGPFLSRALPRTLLKEQS